MDFKKLAVMALVAFVVIFIVNRVAALKAITG